MLLEEGGSVKGLNLQQKVVCSGGGELPGENLHMNKLRLELNLRSGFLTAGDEVFLWGVELKPESFSDL